MNKLLLFKEQLTMKLKVIENIQNKTQQNQIQNGN